MSALRNPPDPMHHVVFLEGSNAPHTTFSFPCTQDRYFGTQPHELAERIKDATIAVLAGWCPITAEHLRHAPRLQCVAITATGFNWLDRQAFAERGITVVHTPQCNVEAVGEHFLALYLSARRKVVSLHNAITGPSRRWVSEGSLVPLWEQGPPLSIGQETLGIIGYGSLGRQIESLAKRVGFGRILVSEHKGETTAREGRCPFEQLIRDSTTIAVCCPMQPATVGLIAEPEFRMMRKEALVINVSRGGIVDEEALAAALRERRIFGAATDVLETEPGGAGTSPLIPDVASGEPEVPNLTITSHLAWFSEKTFENLHRALKLGIEGFVNDTLLEPSSKYTAIVHKGEILK